MKKECSGGSERWLAARLDCVETLAMEIGSTHPSKSVPRAELTRGLKKANWHRGRDRRDGLPTPTCQLPHVDRRLSRGAPTHVEHRLLCRAPAPAWDTDSATGR